MKKIIYIIALILVSSCNNDSAPDCFQNSGDIIQEEYFVEEFTKITVFERAELIIKQAAEYKVVVESGEYLIDDIEVSVQDGRLLLKNNNSCNITREYGITKVYVSAPNLTEIRSATGMPTRSDGVLNYDTLKLISEDDSDSTLRSDGLFNLQVNCNNLQFVINNLSTTFIEGTVNNLNINFAAGDARFEARNLIAQNVTIYHRGSNDIIVNPQVSLTANLVSTGDVIATNTPPNLDIQEQYNGRVIFE